MGGCALLRWGGTRGLAFAAAAALVAPTAGAGELADASLILEVVGAATADQPPTAMPLRFALLSDGQVFVGGTSALLSGRLTKDEAADLERRATDLRKVSGLGSTVAFGPGPLGFKLTVRKGKPLEVLTQGDPATAPAALLPLARLVTDLDHFDHASLRPYEPASYVLAVREGKLVGGCRPWTLSVPLAEAMAGPRVIAAELVGGWPTGATPASVCAGDKTYVMTLRPLVPGERP